MLKLTMMLVGTPEGMPGAKLGAKAMWGMTRRATSLSGLKLALGAGATPRVMMGMGEGVPDQQHLHGVDDLLGAGGR